MHGQQQFIAWIITQDRVDIGQDCVKIGIEQDLVIDVETKWHATARSGISELPHGNKELFIIVRKSLPQVSHTSSANGQAAMELVEPCTRGEKILQIQRILRPQVIVMVGSVYGLLGHFHQRGKRSRTRSGRPNGRTGVESGGTFGKPGHPGLARDAHNCGWNNGLVDHSLHALGGHPLGKLWLQRAGHGIQAGVKWKKLHPIFGLGHVDKDRDTGVGWHADRCQFQGYGRDRGWRHHQVADDAEAEWPHLTELLIGQIPHGDHGMVAAEGQIVG